MKDLEATELADAILGKILDHQPNSLGTQPLNSVSNAEAAAKQVAAFRKTLIEELKKQ